MSATFIRALALAALATAGLTASGCGQKKSLETQEPQVDLSQTMDIFQSPVPPAQTFAPTSVVATVNGYGITALQLQNEVGNLMMRLRGRVPPEQMAQLQPRLREQALEQLIGKRLITDAAKSSNFEVPADEFAAERAKLEATLPPGMSLADALQQRNMTVEQFEREFREEMTVMKFLEKQTDSVPQTTDEELEAYYQEHEARFQEPEQATARHILVKVEAQATEEEQAAQKAKAEAIRARLVAGEDFATVATETTDDTGSKATGGLYGPFPRGQMVPEFDAAVFSQPEGEIGPLVKTDFGYHIIKVEKRNEARAIPLDEVRTNLAAFLRGRKQEVEAQAYVSSLRSNAQVQVIQAP